MTPSYGRWDKWEAEGTDQRAVLREIARHMRNAWQHRDNLGSVYFKAGHQLAHKGWKFGAGVVDLADGMAIPGIKGLRVLIVSGRHEWFERAAELAPGQAGTAADAPTPAEKSYLANLAGPLTPLSRIDVGDAEIWLIPEQGGWRVAAVFVRDATRSGIKTALELAPATRGGCLSTLPIVLITVAAWIVVARFAA